MRSSGLPAALLLAASLGVAAAAPAAPAGVSARLAAPAGELTVGDPITLLLTVEHPRGAVFEDLAAATLWESPEAAADDPAAVSGDATKPPENLTVEGIDPAPADPPRPGETAWRIRCRLFAPGAAAIPGIRIRYRLPGSADLVEARTNPVTIHVGSVLSKPDEPPADIKGAWRLPFDWKTMLAWVIAGLAGVALLIWLGRRWLARNRKVVVGDVSRATVVETPPWERALRELETLLASDLIARGRVKEFHVLLSEIVKRFLGAQHGFDALDSTSEEVLASLGGAAVAGALREDAERLLVACDLVKFAKATPDPRAIESTVESARAIIATGRSVAGSDAERAA